MFQKGSQTSIDWLGDYLDGPSQTGFTNPFSQQRFEYPGEAVKAYGTTGSDETVIVTTIRQGDEKEALRIRLACWYLVAMLPEKGLVEAEEMLREVWEFHQEDQGASGLNKPEPARSSEVQVHSYKERPPLIIS